MSRRLIRSIKVRTHLMLAVALGAAAFLVLPGTFWATTRAIIAWDVGVFAYLAQIGWMVMRADLAEIRSRAPIYDEGALSILVLSEAAATVSIAAVVIELAAATSAGVYGYWQISLAAATIILSWTFVHVIFALHYAHDYYAETDGPTLAFPGGKPPLYGDFFYFAFVIGCANATADINILSPQVRRIALAHGVLSFLFNTTILAMGINIAAGLIGK